MLYSYLCNTDLARHTASGAVCWITYGFCYSCPGLPSFSIDSASWASLCQLKHCANEVKVIGSILKISSYIFVKTIAILVPVIQTTPLITHFAMCAMVNSKE